MALNDRQRHFVHNVAHGMTKSEAYRVAYPLSSPDAATVSASRLLEKAAVQAELESARQATDADRALSRREKRGILAAIARDPTVHPVDAIRAIVVDNRMTGHETPDPDDTEHPIDRAVGQILDRVLRGEPMGDLAVFESAFCTAIERRNQRREEEREKRRRARQR
jgi:hypothetical protein